MYTYFHNTERQVVKYEVCLQILIQTMMASLVMCGSFTNHFSFCRSCLVITTKRTKQLQPVNGNSHFYPCGIVIPIDWKLGLMGEHIDRAEIVFRSLKQQQGNTYNCFEPYIRAKIPVLRFPIKHKLAYTDFCSMGNWGNIQRDPSDNGQDTFLVKRHFFEHTNYWPGQETLT